MQTKIIFTLLLTLLLYATNMQAQVPEKIYGKNKVMKPNEYYIQQLGLWKKEVDSNPKMQMHGSIIIAQAETLI